MPAIGRAQWAYINLTADPVLTEPDAGSLSSIRSWARVWGPLRSRTIIHTRTIYSVFISACAFTSKTDFSFLR